MQYGNKETTKLLDDDGSTVTKHETFRAGVVTGAVKERFAIRHRTEKTDLESLTTIVKQLLSDPAKLDAELKLEKTRSGEQDGYYHIVECYTTISYL